MRMNEWRMKDERGMNDGDVRGKMGFRSREFGLEMGNGRRNRDKEREILDDVQRASSGSGPSGRCPIERCLLLRERLFITGRKRIPLDEGSLKFLSSQRSRSRPCSRPRSLSRQFGLLNVSGRRLAQTHYPPTHCWQTMQNKSITKLTIFEGSELLRNRKIDNRRIIINTIYKLDKKASRETILTLWVSSVVLHMKRILASIAAKSSNH